MESLVPMPLDQARPAPAAASTWAVSQQVEISLSPCSLPLDTHNKAIHHQPQLMKKWPDNLFNKQVRTQPHEQAIAAGHSSNHNRPLGPLEQLPPQGVNHRPREALFR